MLKKVAKVGVKKEIDRVYYVDINGDVSSINPNGVSQKVAKVGIKREKGYLYYIDKKGNVSKAKMQHGGRKKKKR